MGSLGPDKTGLAFILAIKALYPNLYLGDEVEKIVETYLLSSSSKALW